jgi:hypothetical protein
VRNIDTEIPSQGPIYIVHDISTLDRPDVANHRPPLFLPPE